VEVDHLRPRVVYQAEEAWDLAHLNASYHVFLAWHLHAPVGYLTAYRFPRLDRMGDQVYLFDLEVAPSARRGGIGRQLVERLLEACRADGVTLVWAGTALDNVAAQRTFEAVGGRRISETYVEYEFALAKP
jgi:aminoglycoside 3-N-acetyltransferase I